MDAQGQGSKAYLTGSLAARAKQLVQACIDDARQNYARLDRDKQDWLNLLYYRGGIDNQWVVWDKTTNAWVPRPYDGDTGAALPEWVPRATTNVFAQKIDGVAAIMDQSAPGYEWTPATNDPDDLAAAEVLDQALPALLEECDYDTHRAQIHKHITLMDKVFVWAYYDMDARHGTAIMQQLRCNECSAVVPALDEEGEDTEVCPECGSDDLGLAFDDTFQPMGPEQAKGRMQIRMFPSFEGSVPRSAKVADERMMPWVMLHSRYDKDEALRTWPHAKALIDNESASRTSHSASGASGQQRQYADAMSRLTSPSASRIHGGGPGGGGDPTGPVVYIVQHDPTDEFPEGLHAVMIGEELVEAGPLPVKDDEGRPLKSIHIRSYALAPGSPYNKPTADDLVPLQYWRNLIESLLALTLLHNAAPRTFVPASVILEDEITGQPGQQVRYRSMVPGDKPMTESGHNPPEGLYRYLEILDQKFEELSKLNAVLMGNRPSGDPTLGEVQILEERGMAAFKTPLAMLIAFEKRLFRTIVRIARQSAWAPRFRKIRGEDGQWEVEQFAFTDLAGAVDVTCEPSSAWPRSPLMDNLKLKEAVGMGVVIPQMDPELSHKILSRMGLSDLKPSMDADRKQIARQLERWKQAQAPEQILMDPVQLGPHLGPQALQLHWLLKSNFLKTEAAEQLAQLNPPVYQAMLMHLQQVQMMLMMLMAPPASEGGAKGEQEEKKPAPAGSEGDTLGQLLSTGVLQPAAAGQQAAQAVMPSMDDLIQARIMSPLPSQTPPEGAPGPAGNGNAPPM